MRIRTKDGKRELRLEAGEVTRLNKAKDTLHDLVNELDGEYADLARSSMNSIRMLVDKFGSEQRKVEK